MRIIICGAGRVGFNLARYLADHNNHITVIDNSEELIQKINERLEVKAIHGYASYPEVLMRAGIDSADMLIAVTYSDEVNMMACEVANLLFKVPTKIARIRNQSYLNPEWGDLFAEGRVGIDFAISPELEVARAMSRSLTVSGALDIIPLAENSVKVISVRTTEDTPIVNTPISHISGLFPDLQITVVGIVRGDENIVPLESEVIRVKDKVYFAVSADDVEQAMGAFGYEGSGSRRVLILGGGNIGLCLAQDIEKNHPNIRAQIIEREESRAEAIVKDLSDTIVLCGDALDQEVLMEASISTTDTVVAVTEDDRVNVLASVLAKRQGARRALALTNSSSYASLVVSLGIDAIINPRMITVSKILQYVKGGYIRSVYSLGHTFGEIIEADAAENSGLVGSTVKDVNIDNEVIVAALVRGKEVIIPKSTTLVRLGDRVILMIAPRAAPKVEKMFASRLDYY